MITAYSTVQTIHDGYLLFESGLFEEELFE